MREGNRVTETATTSGTGLITLAGAVIGHQTFATAFGISGNTEVYYGISQDDGAQWEVGLGTYIGPTNQLQRDIVLDGSAGASAVNFPVGSKTVYVAEIAEATQVMRSRRATDTVLELRAAAAQSAKILQAYNASGVASFGLNAACGIDFGSDVAPGGVNDLSRHIALFSTTYGFNVTANQFNYNADTGASHRFYAGSTEVLRTSALGTVAQTTVVIEEDDAGGGPTLALRDTDAATLVQLYYATDRLILRNFVDGINHCRIEMVDSNDQILLYSGVNDWSILANVFEMPLGGTLQTKNWATTNATYIGSLFGGSIQCKTSDATASTGNMFAGYYGVTQTFQVRRNGAILNSTGTVAVLSDRSTKENIRDTSPKLSDLNRLRVINYESNVAPWAGKMLGFIADEVEQVFPSLVEKDGETKLKSVKWSIMVPMLVKAVQELTAWNAALEDRIVELETAAYK